MTTRRRTSLLELWRAIEQAGSIRSYVDQQLRERSFLVQRRDTDSMSKKELARYKKALKQEAAERRALEQEAWKAYRESHIVHLGDGIFWSDAHDLDRWDLEDANERARENDLPLFQNPGELAKALDLTVAELRHFAFHRDAATSIHYHRFTIPKKSGKTRPIWAPLPRLKRVQQWILREIVEKLPVHGAAHGFLPGRSIWTNAQAHTKSKTLLQMDLKDFFPTLTWRRVRGIFRKAGYQEQIATLLALICTEAPREEVQFEGKTFFIALGPRCLPQGAPTSPALTNVACMRLDRRLAGLAQALDWRYTRYADDLTFSLSLAHANTPKIGSLMGGVKKVVAEEGFALNPDKTRVSRIGAQQRVTGLIVNGEEKPRVPRKTRRQLRAMLHRLENGAPLEDGTSLNTVQGYAAYVAMTRPEEGAHLLQRLSAIQKNP